MKRKNPNQPTFLGAGSAADENSLFFGVPTDIPKIAAKPNPVEFENKFFRFTYSGGEATIYFKKEVYRGNLVNAVQWLSAKGLNLDDFEDFVETFNTEKN